MAVEVAFQERCIGRRYEGLEECSWPSGIFLPVMRSAVKMLDDAVEASNLNQKSAEARFLGNSNPDSIEDHSPGVNNLHDIQRANSSDLSSQTRLLLQK